jgi:hypothetical protein
MSNSVPCSHSQLDHPIVTGLPRACRVGKVWTRSVENRFQGNRSAQLYCGQRRSARSLRVADCIFSHLRRSAPSDRSLKGNLLALSLSANSQSQASGRAASAGEMHPSELPMKGLPATTLPLVSSRWSRPRIGAFAPEGRRSIARGGRPPLERVDDAEYLRPVGAVVIFLFGHPGAAGRPRLLTAAPLGPSDREGCDQRPTWLFITA